MCRNAAAATIFFSSGGNSTVSVLFSKSPNSVKARTRASPNPLKARTWACQVVTQTKTKPRTLNTLKIGMKNYRKLAACIFLRDLAF